MRSFSRTRSFQVLQDSVTSIRCVVTEKSTSHEAGLEQGKGFCRGQMRTKLEN